MDGEDSAASGSRPSLPHKPSRCVKSRGSSPPAEPCAPPNNAPIPERASGSSQQPKERCQPAGRHRASGQQRVFPALQLLNTAPKRPSSALGGGREIGGLLPLASSCVEAEGASVISLPGPASEQVSWADFARALKPAHALALSAALQFFHKSTRRSS